MRYGVLTYLGRYGLVGLLRPISVYPSEMVYWSVRISIMICLEDYFLYLLRPRIYLPFLSFKVCLCALRIYATL